MKKLKSILTMIFCISFLFGCNNNQEIKKTFNKEELTLIYDEKIFSKQENEYYILFYTPKCKACLDSLKFIEYKYNESNFDIYLINILESSVNYNKQNTTNINCDSIENFYLFKTPYLVTIYDRKVTYEVGGFNEIRTFLNENIKK